MATKKTATPKSAPKKSVAKTVATPAKKTVAKAAAPKKAASPAKKASPKPAAKKVETTPKTVTKTKPKATLKAKETPKKQPTPSKTPVKVAPKAKTPAKKVVSAVKEVTQKEAPKAKTSPSKASAKVAPKKVETAKTVKVTPKKPVATKPVEKTPASAIKPKSAPKKPVEVVKSAAETPVLVGVRQPTIKEKPATPAPIAPTSVRQPLKPNYEVVHPKNTGKKKTSHRQPSRSPFKDSELEDFKTRLLEEREKKAKLQTAMSHDALSRPDEENVEEDGSNSANRADMLTRAEETRKRLRAIDDALRAIENKTYGICAMCGCAISKERLKAAPFAIRCVKCKEVWERQIASQNH